MDYLSNFLYIDRCEKRFKDIADISCKLSTFPLIQKEISFIQDGKEYNHTFEVTGTQVETRKSKSKAHGEVFTPLYLVDKMINKKDDDYWLDESKVNCDLCSGYGQFTIRILRKKYNLNKDYPLRNYLYENHAMIELQLESCLKLLYIFGTDITLYIGDARKLSELKEDDRGILIYTDDGWRNITNFVKFFYKKNDIDKNIFDESIFEKWLSFLDEVVSGSKPNLLNIVKIEEVKNVEIFDSSKCSDIINSLKRRNKV